MRAALKCLLLVSESTTWISWFRLFLDIISQLGWIFAICRRVGLVVENHPNICLFSCYFNLDSWTKLIKDFCSMSHAIERGRRQLTILVLNTHVNILLSNLVDLWLNVLLNLADPSVIRFYHIFTSLWHMLFLLLIFSEKLHGAVYSSSVFEVGWYGCKGAAIVLLAAFSVECLLLELGVRTHLLVFLHLQFLRRVAP